MVVPYNSGVDKTTSQIKPKHTPGPWTAHHGERDSRIAASTLIAIVYSTAFRDVENQRANANLVAASPDLYSDSQDTIAWLLRHLEKLVHVPDTDQSGHPHGYSVVQIPDWEVRQKIEWLKKALAKAEGQKVEGNNEPKA